MKYILFSLLTVVPLISCGGADNKSNTQDQNVIEKQSLKSADNKVEPANYDEANPQSEDHYGIWKMDSTNEVNFKTSHLIAMELRGHVKHVETSYKCSFDFDQNGKMTRYNDSQGELQVMGEPDEEILNLYVPGDAVSYRIDLKNKRLTSTSGGEYGYIWENNYIYDEKGKLASVNEQVTETDEDDNEKTTTKQIKVQVLEADHHGNWTKQSYGGEIETRKISYYDNPIGGFEEDANPLTVSVELKGSIGGDNNSTFTLRNGKGSYKISYGTRKIEAVSFSGDQLIVDAFDAKTNKKLGFFKGSFTSNGSQMKYKGVFKNTITGGEVDFDLKTNK